MSRKTFSISFFIKKSKLLKNGEAPIFMRITVDGERSEASIKRSIHPGYWNSQKGCAKPAIKYGNTLNHFIEHIRHQVYIHQQEMEDKNKTITARSLKNAYLNINDEEDRTIIKTYNDHNEDLKQLIDKGISKGTYERHVTSRKHLQEFIKITYKMSDYYIKDIGPEFIRKYNSYLRIKRNCSNNTTVKYIRNFAKIIRLAINNEWIHSNPFRNLKFKLEEVDRPFLNKHELNELMNKSFEIQRITQVRDVFVFCCFTGLAFVDVKSLSKKDIEIGIDDIIWIRKPRHKTKQWSHIPILPKAKEILDRYKSNPECIRKDVLLPVLSNQKMNAYLKEIADLCGINKNLTTHCARHTFATTVTLANNITMESVSKMLGHSNINITKHYARILDTTISREMAQLATKFSN